MVNVKIPTPLRKFTGDKGEVEVSGSNVSALIEDLEKKHPGIRKRLVDDNGEIRKFINIYIGKEDIRFLKGKDSEIKETDEVSIVPAIAGG